MTRLFSDTDSQAEALYIERLREMSTAQRWEAVRSLNRTLLTLIKSDILSIYPDASEAEIRYHIAVRLYGAELADKVFRSKA